MYQSVGLDSNNRFGGTNKLAHQKGTTRSSMSMVMNEGVEIHFKAVMIQVFTVVGLIVELGTAIEKPKGYIKAYPSIG